MLNVCDSLAFLSGFFSTPDEFLGCLSHGAQYSIFLCDIAAEYCGYWQF
jgi:hypothetical protein